MLDLHGLLLHSWPPWMQGPLLILLSQEAHAPPPAVLGSPSMFCNSTCTSLTWADRMSQITTPHHTILPKHYFGMSTRCQKPRRDRKLRASLCLTSWLKPRAVRDGNGEVRAQLGKVETLDAGVAHDVLDQHMLRGDELGLVFVGYELSLLNIVRARQGTRQIGCGWIFRGGKACNGRPVPGYCFHP